MSAFRPADPTLLARLALALAGSDLGPARDMAQTLRQRSPDDPNARLLFAVLARRDGRPDESYELLQGLRQERPLDSAVTLQLGNTLQAMGRQEGAAEMYREVLAKRPMHAEAAFNLAASIGDRPGEAGPLYLRAARADPSLAPAYHRLLRCAGAQARIASPPAREFPRASRYSLSVVCCSITPDRLERLRANLAQRLERVAWELVAITDARSLAEGYGRGLARATGEFVAFCHDDIRVLAPDFGDRLHAHLRSFDLIGAAGATRCSGPGALWSGPPHVHGWVTYPDAEGRLHPSISGTLGPVVSDAQVLDGMFLAGRRELFERIGFDSELFDGFDLYDIDFSWRARRTGARLAICQDLLFEHVSLGGFGPRWQHYADRFVAKFPELGRERPYAGPTIFQGEADSEDHVRAIYGWLQYWIESLDAAQGTNEC